MADFLTFESFEDLLLNPDREPLRRDARFKSLAASLRSVGKAEAR